MVNEEIFGGLEIALSRGNSLEKAMMSFFNAGYDKLEIEEAARAIQTKHGEILTPEQNIQIKKASTIIENNSPIKKSAPKNVAPQAKPSGIRNSSKMVSYYVPQKGHSKEYSQGGYDVQNLEKNLSEAIHSLNKLKIPSKIRVINEGPGRGGSFQKVSNYGPPPKPPGKFVTFFLVFLLIFLLGVLATVFFFRDELINIFNNFGAS